MIFISHNHKDKGIVEPIAEQLAEIYGRANVFYDSWSIQPGESIIGKMNEGLERCEFFFFFVSNNSIPSKMVKLEWQSALMKTAREDIRFIPVRIDNCVMPAILTDKLYIDGYNQGMEITVRQMVDVVSGTNTYRSGRQQFHNLEAEVRVVSPSTYKITIQALHFVESISHYLILFSNPISEINLKCVSDSMFNNGDASNLKIDSGLICNAKIVGVFRATTPGFPVVFSVTTKNGAPIQLKGILREAAVGKWENLSIKVTE